MILLKSHRNQQVSTFVGLRFRGIPDSIWIGIKMLASYYND